QPRRRPAARGRHRRGAARPAPGRHRPPRPASLPLTRAAGTVTGATLPWPRPPHPAGDVRVTGHRYVVILLGTRRRRARERRISPPAVLEQGWDGTGGSATRIPSRGG